MLNIKVIFEDGNTLETKINATEEEARAYYVGNLFNVGDSKDNLQRCIWLEVIEPTTPKPKYYGISESVFCHAKEMNSYYDYKPGTATAEYRHMVDKAAEFAESCKSRVDAEYHGKIDSLLDTYSRKLAANLNSSAEIDARCPSVYIAGPANFPVRQKEKQNAARDRNMEEYNRIQGLLDKMRGIGHGGIRSDDQNAAEKLTTKIEQLTKEQDTMKAVNAYYRKHKTLDGCPILTPVDIAKLNASMSHDWRTNPKPFESYELSNNNANIRRLKQRLEGLKKNEERTYEDKEIKGGKLHINKEINRIQFLFDEKPDEDTRKVLKSHGFRWAPSQKAWQRLLNNNGLYAMRCVLLYL